MSKFSLTQAAKAVGKSKPTISKAIKTGRLSAEKIGNGYQIDASELFRVYPKKTEKEVNQNQSVNPQLSMLEREIEVLREQLRKEEKTSEDLREDRDKWRQQATALLEDKRSKRRWFWQR